MGTRIYIDGFNLYYRCLRPLGMQWLNLEAFFRRLRKDDAIQQIYYFTAPMQGTMTVPHATYLRALGTLPLVRIIHGVFQTQWLNCEVGPCTHAGIRSFVYLQEKRTDVNIALQMLDDAVHQEDLETLVLVSGDSDLVPAVRRVRELAKSVYLYVPCDTETNLSCANELRGVAYMSKNLPLKYLDRAQFTNPIADPAGNFNIDPNW